MELFTLEFWKDDRVFVGHIVEVPGLINDGVSLTELMDNLCRMYPPLRDARSRVVFVPHPGPFAIPTPA